MAGKPSLGVYNKLVLNNNVESKLLRKRQKDNVTNLCSGTRSRNVTIRQSTRSIKVKQRSTTINDTVYLLTGGKWERDN